MANNFDRQFLIQKLKEEPQNLTNDEKAQIIEFINTKRYGLVWEDKPERAWEQMKDFIPVLEDANKAVLKDTKTKKNLNHILIEGDNLHALTSLLATHEGKVDVIYIDPPYNLGNKDFYYNDTFIDVDNPFRHSAWLSFINKRLKIAKRLLSDNGVIFISIDDTEQAALTILCDEIFSKENFISNSFVLDNLKGKANDNFITSVGSRLIIYAKSKSTLSELGFNDVENPYGKKVESKYQYEDEEGYYNLITFKKTGQSKFRADRPKMFYPILEKDGMLYSITQSEFEKIYDDEQKCFNDDFLAELKQEYSDYNFILPTDSNGEYLRWTSGFERFCKEKNVNIIYIDGVKQKTRPAANEMLQVFASGRPKSFMYSPAYSTGTDNLADVIGANQFSFPKPLQLINDIQKLICNKEYTILDFFAGSGTTLHATMLLNAEDGGNRQCILVTNNENNICEEITYERNRRVIEGYKKPNGEDVEGLQNNNLRYYRTRFVPREKDLTNIERFARQSVTLLNIKHDAYNEQDTFGELNINKKQFRYFKDGDKQFLVILDIEAIEQITGELMDMEVETPIPTYVFTTGHYPYSEDFWQVNKKVELYPYPTCIYGACEKEMPKMDNKLIDQDENIELTEDEANFSYEDLNKE